MQQMTRMWPQPYAFELEIKAREQRKWYASSLFTLALSVRCIRTQMGGGVGVGESVVRGWGRGLGGLGGPPKTDNGGRGGEREEREEGEGATSLGSRRARVVFDG